MHFVLNGYCLAVGHPVCLQLNTTCFVHVYVEVMCLFDFFKTLRVSRVSRVGTAN